MKLFSVLPSIILLFFFSCVSNKSIAFFKPGSDEQRKIIDAYFTMEILNGLEYTKAINDKNGVIEIYGTPLKEKIDTVFPFYFEGGNVVSVRTLIYSDLIHRYYVFESGSELYLGIEANQPLQRFKTINIGDSITKLKDMFGEGYSHNDSMISYYGLNTELVFVTDSGIITKILGNYLLI